MWGLYTQITVVLGFPLRVRTIILGEIDSTSRRLSQALDERRKPIPPTDELLEFLVDEDVTS